MLDLNPADDLPIEELSIDPMQGSKTGSPQHDQTNVSATTVSVTAGFVAAGIMLAVIWGITRLLR